ncbi:PulJ/GspJ family protein [Thalassotalea ganghwensis]
MRTRGYTLIEVLVAMVIFSVLMTLSVSSYRYFFNATVSKGNTEYDLSLLTKRKIINNAIKGLQPYYYAGLDGKNELFFKGEKRYFSFITNTPGYLDEPLVIANFFVRESGKVLAYCELPLGSVNLLNYRFRESHCNEYQVYTSADNIEFSYFTWKDVLELDNYYSEMLNIAIKPKPLWREQYDSAKTIILPLYIKVMIEGGSRLLPSELLFEVPEELPHTKADKNAL